MSAESESNPLACPECGESFKNKLALSMHRVHGHGRYNKKKSNKRKPAGKIPVKHCPECAPPIRFCPCCGFNLEILAVAMKVAATTK